MAHSDGRATSSIHTQSVQLLLVERAKQPGKKGEIFGERIKCGYRRFALRLVAYLCGELCAEYAWTEGEGFCCKRCSGFAFTRMH